VKFYNTYRPLRVLFHYRLVKFYNTYRPLRGSHCEHSSQWNFPSGEAIANIVRNEIFRKKYIRGANDNYVIR